MNCLRGPRSPNMTDSERMMAALLKTGCCLDVMTEESGICPFILLPESGRKIKSGNEEVAKFAQGTRNATGDVVHGEIKARFRTFSFGSSPSPRGIWPYKSQLLRSMYERVLIFVNQLGNFELKELKLRSLTAREVKLIMPGPDEIEPDRPQLERCSSDKKGSLLNTSMQLEAIMERSILFIEVYFKERRLAIQSRLGAVKPENPEEGSRYCSLERLPKFEGIGPLNPAFDKFKYRKFFKEPRNGGIGMLLNVLELKSRYCNDLSFPNEDLISPLKFHNPDLAGEAELNGYGFWRLMAIPQFDCHN
ncbi:hypothetical protein Ancab_006550 [Ancistrocladus abbreviatus]